MHLEFWCPNRVDASFSEQRRNICLLQRVIFIISVGWIKFLGEFHFVSSFYCVIVVSDLDATTGSIGWHRSRKNLQASYLHMTHFHGIYHGDFGAACSIWEIRAEICLGQNFHRSRWGPFSNLFRAGAASFRSTCAFKGINTSEFTQ